MVGLVVFIISMSFAVCQADIPETPPFQCGAIPKFYKCFDFPLLVTQEVLTQCNSIHNECVKMSCVFRQSGWMDGYKVDKPKVMAASDQFATDNPQWQAAVGHMKSACLQEDLPAQGIHLNCPAYDTSICITKTLLRYVPSQWSSGAECQNMRRYVAECPFCPAECLANEKPVGSCNSCNALPTST